MPKNLAEKSRFMLDFLPMPSITFGTGKIFYDGTLLARFECCSSLKARELLGTLSLDFEREEVDNSIFRIRKNSVFDLKFLTSVIASNGTEAALCLKLVAKVAGVFFKIVPEEGSGVVADRDMFVCKGKVGVADFRTTCEYFLTFNA